MGGVLTTVPYRIPPVRWTSKTFDLRPGSWFLAPPPIPPPRPFAILFVETQLLAPLDARGSRWPHRAAPLTGRPDGPHRRPGHPPAPSPSPIAGAAPRPPRCTASSGTPRNLPRPGQRGRSHGRRYTRSRGEGAQKLPHLRHDLRFAPESLRNTSPVIHGAIWAGGFWPTVLHGPDAFPILNQVVREVPVLPPDLRSPNERVHPTSAERA